MTKLILKASVSLVAISLMAASGAAFARDLRQDAAQTYLNNQANADAVAAQTTQRQNRAIRRVPRVGLVSQARSAYSAQQANASATQAATTARQNAAIASAPNVGLVGAARSSYSAQQANASAQAAQNSQAVSAAIGRATAAANNHR